LELVFHHWIERAQWLANNNGDYFREETMHDLYSFQVCPGQSVAIAYRPLYSRTLWDLARDRRRVVSSSALTQMDKEIEVNRRHSCI
jgi:hypothetical protein